jgi:glyoxylate reductase
VPRVVVTRGLPEPALRSLRESGADVWVSSEDRALRPEELHEAVRGADAIVSMLHDRVDDRLLAAAGEQLKVVANVAVGYDNVDLEAARRHGVTITNTPGVLTDATADLAIALMLAITRRLGEGERRIRSGEPWTWSIDFMLGRGLREKTLGIVGYGAIGRATAERARAFGMEVVYTRRTAGAEPGRVDLGDLLERAHVVSLHCPLTPRTRHLIDADALARMRRDAYLVNTARGPIVDEAALAAALRAGAIAGAALDVFEREPEVDPGLVALDNVVLVPHLGSATVETRTAMAELAAANAVAVLAGRQPPTPVPPA